MTRTEKKKWSQNSSTIGAVLWYVTQLHPWHYFGATFKGGAVFVYFLNMIINDGRHINCIRQFDRKKNWCPSLRKKRLHHPKLPGWPGWSHFGSIFFLSVIPCISLKFSFSIFHNLKYYIGHLQ